MKNEIKKAVEVAIWWDDLDIAVSVVQDALGVTDGGYAAMWFGGKTPLIESERDRWWRDLNLSGRRAVMTRYAENEAVFPA